MIFGFFLWIQHIAGGCYISQKRRRVYARSAINDHRCAGVKLIFIIKRERKGYI